MPPLNKSQMVISSLKLRASLLPYLGASYSFGDADFYKIKVRKIFNKLHNDLTQLMIIQD
jgi:hypothetical protein